MLSSFRYGAFRFSARFISFIERFSDSQLERRMIRQSFSFACSH